MSLPKRAIYMALGAVLALGLAFGIYSTYAQSDDSTDSTTPDSGSSVPLPFLPGGGRVERGGSGEIVRGLGTDSSALAEALGITADELQTAIEAAQSAALDQAVADGLLTQEQADAIRSNGFGRGHGFGIGGADFDALLAEALGISTEDLQAAQQKVYSDRLAQMVTDGVLTQEQADLMQAYKAVEGYVDYAAIQESVQGFYQAAIDKALADGVITQAQADQMSSNLSTLGGFGPHGFGMPFGPGPERGGRGHHGGGWGGSFHSAPSTTPDTNTSDSNA